MSQYTTEGWARGSLHCCVLCIWLRLHFIYHLVIIYVEVIYNSGHYHQVLSSSELSPPQVTDAVWPGLLAPVVPHFRAVQHLFMMCGVPHQTQHLTVYFILDPLKQIVVIKFRNTFRTLLTASRKIPGHWCLIWSKRYLKSDLLGLIWSHTSDKTAAPQQKSIPRHRWSSPHPPHSSPVCVSFYVIWDGNSCVESSDNLIYFLSPGVTQF